MADAKDKAATGYCRRALPVFPPRRGIQAAPGSWVTEDMGAAEVGAWPRTFDNDWCGEWAAKEGA